MSAMQEYARVMDQLSTVTSPAGQAVRDILNLHQPDPDRIVYDWRGAPNILVHDRLVPACSTCDDCGPAGAEGVPWPCDTARLILVRFP